MADSKFEFSSAAAEEESHYCCSSMSPADELFCNGTIRPFSPSSRLSFHHHRCVLGSVSSPRSSSCHAYFKIPAFDDDKPCDPCLSAKSCKNGRKWSLLKLKDLLLLLPRSRSEGRERDLAAKDKEQVRSNTKDKEEFRSNANTTTTNARVRDSNVSERSDRDGLPPRSRCSSADSKARRSSSASLHEILYTENRAQSEMMKKRTFLPYSHSVLACIGRSPSSFALPA